MGDDSPKTGRYRLGSAFIWAAAQGAVAHYADEGTFRTISAGFGGIVAGWATASILGRLARWGGGYKVLMIAGLVVGILISSGAVVGLSFALNWFRPDAINVDWESLGKFLLSWSLVPAAVLGLVTGVYVRAKIPREPG